MPLTQQQIDKLNATYSRPGGQTATDLKNIEYAKTQGYKPPITPTQKQQLDATYSRPGGQTPTDLKNIDYAKTLGYVPKIPDKINVNNLTNGTTIPPATPAVDNTPAFVKGIQESQKSIQSIIDEANKPLEPKQKEQTGFRQKLLDKITQLGNKGTQELQLEKQAGVPQQIQQLKDINTQIAQRTAEFNKAIEHLSTSTGLSTVIAGKQGQLRRQMAVELGGLSAVQQALAGNISLAQDTAKRTVDLQFAPVEADIKNLQTQLGYISQDMTVAEKKRAEKLNLTLQERQRQIDTAKEERNTILNYATQVAQNGAPNEVITQMSQAKTIEDALKIGGSYLSKDENPAYKVVKTGEKTYGTFNPSTGVVEPITPGTQNTTGSYTTNDIIKFADGATGGQCGDFVHKVLSGIPPVGNTYKEKQNFIDTYGMLASKWQTNPQVGDVLAIDSKQPFGHVAIVNSVNGDGTVTLTESNWGGKEKVSNTRTVKTNDPSIYGAYRGKGVQNNNVDLSTEDKAFNKDLSTNIDSLASGKSTWADTYNKLKVKYGASSPELFTPLSDAKKTQIENAYNGAIKFVNGDQTVMDALLGKQYYY